MSQVESIKRKIVEIVQKEYRSGMVNTFEGNVSARLGDRVFITPSQIAKDVMTPDMIIELDLDGNVVNLPEGMKPSTEAGMHLEIYRLRKDVKAVVHNHSLYATAFAVNNMPIESQALTEMILSIGDVPVAKYGSPGTAAIYEDIKNVIGNRFAVLLANHGLVTFGPDLDTAFSYAESVEKVAQTLVIASRIGTPANVPDEEAQALRERGNRMRDEAIAKALAE